MGSARENLKVDNDGLPCSKVHHWAEDKYRLLAFYDELFSSSMKKKWDQRVYIDLYAGSGFSHIQGTRRFLKGSPIIALTVTYPFDKYIFCEEDEELLAALRARSGRLAPQANVSYIPGNCDAKIDEICGAISEPWSAENRVLSLCLGGSVRFRHQIRHFRRDFRASIWISWYCLRSAWTRIEITITTLRGIPRRSMRRSETPSGEGAGRPRRQEERFQAVSGGGVLQKHGIPRLPSDASTSYEAGEIG